MMYRFILCAASFSLRWAGAPLPPLWNDDGGDGRQPCTGVGDASTEQEGVSGMWLLFETCSLV